MLVAILIFDAALVAWSLHLMEQAFENQEFSLMLAGTLVALSAAAISVSYFLMNNCLGALSKTSQLIY